MNQKFELGQIVATTTLFNYCKEKRFLLLPYLLRHANGAWGSVCEEDKKENDESLKNGCRLLSQYELPDKTKFWIITEADRNSTTMLFPEDY